MVKVVPPFELMLNSVTMKVVEQESMPAGYRAFTVVFSSKRPIITVVRATNAKGERFWTTIPENESRQREAEGVGKLIQDYLSKMEE
jgi:hypothetical protein